MKKIVFFVLICIICGSLHAQQIWTEDFENPTFPPSGWSILDLSGVKIWERESATTHSGTGAALHDFAAASYGLQETALVSPPITIPDYGMPILDFWSRLQLIGYQYSGVLISTTVNNNINAFTEVKVISGTEIELGVWKQISIPLDDFLGETIYIAFYYKNTDGHRWFVDDVSITHMESFVDMQALSITPETGTYPFFIDNEQVTVRLKNNGGNAATGFGLHLYHEENLIATETFTGSIPSLSIENYTFNATLNLSAAGAHHLKVVVEITGDQVPTNNMVTATVTNLDCQVINTFPFFEGFEDYGENLPPCWTQEFVDGPIEWRTLASAPSSSISPETAFAGNYRAVFYCGAYDRITKLVTPPLDLSALSNPALKFHHVQQRWDGDQDYLKVYYRTSTLNPWILLEQYTSEISEWTERTISLPEPSSHYYIAFEGWHNWGHSVQIDNVSVGDFFETDIEVRNINPKGTYLDLPTNQEITATIKNNGRNSVNGFSISLFVNENFVATENFLGSIAGLSEADYTFQTPVNLSFSGYYDIKVVVELIGDEVPANDMLTVTVRNLVCTDLTFPHGEGFEEELFPPACWTTIGQSWERRTYGGHESINRAVCPWWKGNEAWLISPKFSLSAEGNYVIEFWSECYETRFYTYSGVWISTTNNTPAAFTQIRELTSAERPESEWVKIEISLNDYAGQDIYFAFKYTTPNIDNGHMWSVDNFNIYNLNTYTDAELVAITAPSTGVSLTNEEEVKVKIKNNGTENISNFPLMLEVDQVLLATETFTGSIPSMHEAEYIFIQKIDLSELDKTYTVTATVNVEEDENANNNSKSISVTHLPNSVIVNEINPLKTWVSNDMLYIDGLKVGDDWRIYSVIGSLVLNGVAHNETVRVKLDTHGVYILQSGNHVVKVVY